MPSRVKRFFKKNHQIIKIYFKKRFKKLFCIKGGGEKEELSLSPKGSLSKKCTPPPPLSRATGQSEEEEEEIMIYYPLN